MIQFNGSVSVMTNTILKDYQIKLIPFLRNDEDTQEEKAKKITREEAIMLLKAESSIKTESQWKIDKFVLDHLDPQFLKDHKVEDEIFEDYMVNVDEKLKERRIETVDDTVTENNEYGQTNWRKEK